MDVGIVGCIGAAYIMLFVDTPMYFDSARLQSRRYLKLKEGVRNALTRRVATSGRAAWQPRFLRIHTYFTFGIWLGIGMIFIKFRRRDGLSS
jgi:hypothetical protein